MSDLARQRIRKNIEAHARGEDATCLDLGNCGMTEVPEEIRESHCTLNPPLYFCEKNSRHGISTRSFF